MNTAALKKHFSLIWASWQENLIFISNLSALSMLLKLVLNSLVRLYTSWYTVILLTIIGVSLLSSVAFENFLPCLFASFASSLILTLLISRASIYRKDFIYFLKSFTTKNILFFFSLALLLFLTFLKILPLFYPFLMGFISFFILFWLDSAQTIVDLRKALASSIRMMYLNLPLLIGTAFLNFLFTFIMYKSAFIAIKQTDKLNFGTIGILSLTLLLFFCLLPLSLIPWVIIYIKKVNEQESFYN